MGVLYSLSQARAGSAQGEGDGRGGGDRVPPLFEQLINKIKYSGTSIQKRAKELAKYVHYNEIRHFISRFFFILPWFYYYWNKKKNSSLDRGLRYRGSTLINFHISSIFVGIRIFQHLNSLLVHFDPISLMCSKPVQNAYIYKTAISPRLPHFQTSQAM